MLYKTENFTKKVSEKCVKQKLKTNDLKAVFI